ncbi:MAG: hypothetical protein AAB783_02380 [Patescibacteria group bacterium]
MKARPVIKPKVANNVSPFSFFLLMWYRPTRPPTTAIAVEINVIGRIQNEKNKK